MHELLFAFVIELLGIYQEIKNCDGFSCQAPYIPFTHDHIVMYVSNDQNFSPPLVRYGLDGDCPRLWES